MLKYIALFGVLGVAIYLFTGSGDIDRSKEVSELDSGQVSERSPAGIRQDTNPPPVAEKLAPGTALVRLKILEVSFEEEVPANVRGQVEEVMGYGSSTPPLAVDAKLSLEVQGFVKAHPQWKDSVRKGAVLRVLLSYTAGIRQLGGEDNPQKWSINKLIK